MYAILAAKYQSWGVFQRLELRHDEGKHLLPWLLVETLFPSSIWCLENQQVVCWGMTRQSPAQTSRSVVWWLVHCKNLRFQIQQKLCMWIRWGGVSDLKRWDSNLDYGLNATKMSMKLPRQNTPNMQIHWPVSAIPFQNFQLNPYHHIP